MSNSIIEVTNLSKSYTISHEGRERYTALRDVMAQKAKKIFSFPKNLTTSSTKEEFWALKDVSFNIEQGDRVGIIGRNGAGKSTLLKILSRITEPTAGEIKIKGRVASLLEVGTGFHPELTGRENIFLNGAILGMSRIEIRKHFDAIVDFAEIEKFLDTPVKRYSSGMYVRLAFAVAAHLEPEILVIDEVLAVGDAQFQKKCLGKMEDVSKNEGRTVLFVSHNIQAIKKLCSKGVYLSKGIVAFNGTMKDTVEQYLKKEVDAGSDGRIDVSLSTYYTGQAKFVKSNIENNGKVVSLGQKIIITCEIECQENIEDVFLDVRVNSIDIAEITHSSHLYENDSKALVNLKKGANKIKIEIDNLFQPGNYDLTFGIHELRGKTLDYVENINPFEVLNISEENSDFIFPSGWEIGKVRINSTWEFYE